MRRSDAIGGCRLAVCPLVFVPWRSAFSVTPAEQEGALDVAPGDGDAGRASSSEAGVHDRALPRGATVGRYVIIDVLGGGGMGVVYTAYDAQLDRRVAIKLVHPDLTEGVTDEVVAETQGRLLREAQAMARLHHPNVITVHDFGAFDGGLFLAMEFMDGENLRQWLQTPHSWRERLKVLCEAGKGLAAAHAAGLVHRDFKPDNILVGRDGRVAVLDFGLARGVSDRSAEGRLPAIARLMTDDISGRTDDPFSAPLTGTGHLLGTVGYISKEQLLGETVNAATDQFGFAATLYVALYGERPFPSRTLKGYLAEIKQAPNEPRGGKDVPRWLRPIVLRGLSADPAARFASMDEMLAALARDPATFRRRAGQAALALFAVASSAVGITSAVVHSQKERAQACAPDRDEMKGIWDEPVRERARSSFAAADPEFGPETFDHVAPILDRWVGEWAAMREEACRAATIEHRQTREVYKLRSECLDRRKMELHATTRVLREADRKIAEKGIAIASGLELISFCADVPSLQASPGLPDDPAKRGAVLDVRARLAEIDTKWNAGQSDDSVQLAAETVRLARLSEDKPTIAEALLKQGHVLGLRLGKHDEATPLLREALLGATSAGQDATVVRAAAALTRNLAAPATADKARDWLALGQATMLRQGANEALELELTHAEATVALLVELDTQRTLQLDEKILSAERRLYGAHLRTAAALFNVGNAYLWQGDPGRARTYFRETVALDTALMGPSAADRAIDSLMLAETELELGEFESGEASARAAIAVLDRHGLDDRESDGFQVLAWSKLVQGDAQGAIADAEQSRTHHLKANDDAEWTAGAQSVLGLALVRAGRVHEALPICEAALAAQDSVHSILPEKAYSDDALRCEAEALIALGQPASAVILLERDLTLHKRVFPADYARVQFAMARALDGTRRAPGRAFELAAAARQGFLQYPFLKFELDEVSAWIAARPTKP